MPRLYQLVVGLHFALCGAFQLGCITYAHNAIPANRLPPQLMADTKNDKVPINLSLLSQQPPPAHLIGPQDVLSIYIQGVLPPRVDDVPVISTEASLNPIYYPPRGTPHTPNLGVPVQVQASGTVALPLISPVRVEGYTVEQATEEIRRAFLAKGVLQPGRDRIYVGLYKPRVHRILILREDSPTDIPTLKPKTSDVLTKRGRGDVIDLPAFENDLLHALAATGGLPGLDVYNQAWILRSPRTSPIALDAVKTRVEAGEAPEQLFQQTKTQTTAIRIPLRLCPDEPLPFGPQDILLHDGDIVYLEPRIRDFFYTGGLLQGGQVPLPRDHDVDILEAIAIANGSVGGIGGVSGAYSAIRTQGPGNIIPPTRAMVIRKLPNGQQVTIRVDLAKAKLDARERILIQPDDFISLYYKPGETTANVLLNFFNFNVILNPKEIF